MDALHLHVLGAPPRTKQAANVSERIGKRLLGEELGTAGERYLVSLALSNRVESEPDRLIRSDVAELLPPDKRTLQFIGRPRGVAPPTRHPVSSCAL